jgi:hypothetical protein
MHGNVSSKISREETTWETKGRVKDIKVDLRERVCEGGVLDLAGSG